MATTSSTLAQDFVLPICWIPAQCPRNLGSLPRLRNVAAPFPFAGSSSGEAGYLSQMHRTHTGHGQGWLSGEGADFNSTCIGYTSEISTESSLLLPLGRQGLKVTSVHTHMSFSRLTSMRTAVDPLSTSMAPLSI